MANARHIKFQSAKQDGHAPDQAHAQSTYMFPVDVAQNAKVAALPPQRNMRSQVLHGVCHNNAGGARAYTYNTCTFPCRSTDHRGSHLLVQKQPNRRPLLHYCFCTCRQALQVRELLIRVSCLEVVLDCVKDRHLHVNSRAAINCAKHCAVPRQQCAHGTSRFGSVVVVANPMRELGEDTPGWRTGALLW